MIVTLHDLTKKNKIWNWTNECQTTFDMLKERFSTAPMLSMPDMTKPFILEMDASKWAIGAMLLKKQEDDPDQMQLANLQPRIICNNLCLR